MLAFLNTEMQNLLEWKAHKTSEDIIVKKSTQPIIESGKKTVSVDDFILLKVLGKGSFGKVLLVKKKDDRKIYAMKCLKKQV